MSDMVQLALLKSEIQQAECEVRSLARELKGLARLTKLAPRKPKPGKPSREVENG